MAPLFVDTHAHIQGPEFQADIDSVVRRAEAAGVARIIVPGVDAETSAAAALLSDRFPSLYFAAGYHPHEASRLDRAALRGIAGLLSHPKAVAVGEIGLDYYRMHSPRRDQLAAFEAMLDLALERKLPVIVHCRDAADDISVKLEEWSLRAAPVFGGRPLGVLHYFSGTPEEAARYVELGFLISVHTSVTHPRADQLRRVAAEAPLHALVIETDSPYGAPQSVRGKRNEPEFVSEAAAKIAEVRGLTLEGVAQATTANAARLFGLGLPAGGAAIGASA
ncbi:MAG TPA: TatD family hydrolase [Dehalococcoidia bacterium]|nr:TatD family hydrolase [Dehalococcoidia bacterium]